MYSEGCEEEAAAAGRRKMLSDTEPLGGTLLGASLNGSPGTGDAETGEGGGGDAAIAARVGPAPGGGHGHGLAMVMFAVPSGIVRWSVAIITTRAISITASSPLPSGVGVASGTGRHQEEIHEMTMSTRSTRNGMLMTTVEVDQNWSTQNGEDK